MTPLRIAITADPYLPVPPETYGGIERVVDFLVRGLIARGHCVTIYAHPDSRTAGTHVPYGAGGHSRRWSRLRDLGELGLKVWMKRGEFDVIHSFGRLAALSPVLPKRLLPKIQSYQREIPWKGVGQAVRLGGKSIWFTACSSGMYRSGDCGRWRTIFNGVDLLKYRFSASVAPDAPLAFLGRLEPIKGAHNAIAIARAAARPLVIAGNRVASCEAYFEREIAPWLNRDGISYAGPVDDQAKSDLLGRCAALLMPIEWEEPFGIVMAEALACGTPVIAFSRGSAPEVVQDGVNGYLRRDTSEAAAAVECLNRLNRADIRRDCETRFGSEAIVDQYESLYQEAVAASGLAN